MIQTIWRWLTGSPMGDQPAAIATTSSTPSVPSSHADADAVDTLARTVYGEARGEGRAGMEAVAAVVMNRVRRADWRGKTVLEVCRKPAQFSCWGIDDPNRQRLLDADETNPQFAVALEIADRAIDGLLPDPTNGALSYYATSIDPPAWAIGQQPCAVIGRHRFYRV